MTAAYVPSLEYLFWWDTLQLCATIKSIFRQFSGQSRKTPRVTKKPCPLTSRKKSAALRVTKKRVVTKKAPPRARVVTKKSVAPRARSRKKRRPPRGHENTLHPCNQNTPPLHANSGIRQCRRQRQLNDSADINDSADASDSADMGRRRDVAVVLVDASAAKEM